MDMLDYGAHYETPWLDLSDRHKMVRTKIEENLLKFLKGNHVPNVAIAGPYGQGKSQLLLHLMRLALENNGLPIYTHATNLLGLVEQGMDAAQFARRIKIAIEEEIKALNGRTKGPFAVDEHLSEIIRGQFPQSVPNSRVLLLVDEWEQIYQELQERVKTDDRNPLRALLDDYSVHFVLAFAPRSVYDLGASASLGGAEADRRRLTIFRIPPVDPAEFSKYLNLPRGQANFFWWVGRGRMGLVLKACQDSQNFDLDSAEGLRGFIKESMGEISGVPAIELERLFQKHSWKDVFSICPKQSDKGTRCLFFVDEDFHNKAQRFFMKLGFSAEHAVSLSSYMGLLLRGLCGDENQTVINSMDDFPALVEATRDLALEFEEESDMLRSLQEKYEKFGDLASLIPHAFFDSSGALGEIRELETGLPFTLRDILTFFPFPLSVPTFPGITEKEVQNWLGSEKDLPLAKDRKDGTFFLIFDSFPTFDRYIKAREHAFLEQALPENRHTAILLLEGGVGEVSGAALWLKGQKRLEIRPLMPRLLSDFIRNACYLIHEKVEQPGPIDDFKQGLLSLREEFAKKGDRASARKVLHYTNAVEEAFRLLSQTHESNFTYADDRRGTLLAELRKQREIPVALPYPFIIAFADEDMKGIEMLSEARELLGRDGVLQRFLPEAGGFRGAVDFFPARRRGQPVQLSEQVQRVRAFYSQWLPCLIALVDAVSEESFMYLADDDLTRFLLRTLYSARKQTQIQPASFEQVKSTLQRALDCYKEIKEEEEKLKEVTGLSFHPDLNFSDGEKTGIEKLINLADRAKDIRREYQYVYLEFAKEVMSKILETAGEYEKKVKAMKFEVAWRELLGLKELLSYSDNVTSEALAYLSISRDKLSGLINRILRESRQNTVSLGSANIDNLQGIRVNFSEATALKDAFADIEYNVKAVQEQITRLEQIKGVTHES
jgi:hypothetical protein